MIEQNTIKAFINKDFFVVVRKYKFDNIRQESYWATVNKLCKSCKSLEQAEIYAKRVAND